MLNNRFFKTTNSFICIGADRQIMRKIIQHMHENLKIIHFFVSDTDSIDTETLTYFAHAAAHVHLKMVLHCADKYVRGRLRRALKGVPKGKWFHLSLNYKVHFALSDAKKLIVVDKDKIMLRETRFQVTTIQTIDMRTVEDKF